MTMKLDSNPRWLSGGGLLTIAAFSACGPTFGSGDEVTGGSSGTSAGEGGASGRTSQQGGRSGTGAGGSTMSTGSGGSPAHAGEPGRGGLGGRVAGSAAGEAGEADAGEAPAHGGSTAGTAGTSGATAGTGAAAGAGGAGSGGAAGAGGLSGSGGSGGSSGVGGTLSGSSGSGGNAGFAGNVAGSGGGGKGGSGGSGGSAGRCLPVLVIDDMEDGDDLTCPNQGRSGDWWTATNTPTGTINPPTQGNFPAYALGQESRAGSSYGMRLSGANFGQTDADWASLGFYLANEAAYDLTPYQGLAFYAKSRSVPVTVHVKLATSTTTPVSEGGACLDDCNDHYAVMLTFDATWRELTVPFAALAQEGWGPKAKDLEHTLFVYFGYLGTDAGPASFDFLVDDVRFY